MRSPPAVIVQLPHVVADRQAHVAGDPQAGGSVRQAYVPAATTAPPIIRSQNCVPCVQKRGPHANVPDGGVQLPWSLMSTPAAAAMHGLL